MWVLIDRGLDLIYMPDIFIFLPNFRSSVLLYMDNVQISPCRHTELLKMPCFCLPCVDIVVCAKYLTFYRQHFEIRLLFFKLCNWSLSMMIQLHRISRCSCDGLAPNRRQAVTCTSANDERCLRRNMASPCDDIWKNIACLTELVGVFYALPLE